MFNKLVIIMIISGVIYLFTSTMNYNLDYEVQDLEEEIGIIEQELDEILVDQRIHLSREQAKGEYKLDLNNNWYYLKDNDGEKES